MGKRGFILVEGIADLVFIKDFVEIHYGYSMGSVKIESNTKEIVINKDTDSIVIYVFDGKDLDSKGNKIQRLEQSYNRNPPEFFIIIFDADENVEESRKDIISNMSSFRKVKEEEIFLFPNNRDNGDLECLLEKIVKENRILECWNNFEICVSRINSNFTVPAKKSKIHTYLEVLNDKGEKKACKEPNRDYKDSSKWDLRNTSIDCVNRLKSFLDQYLL